MPLILVKGHHGCASPAFCIRGNSDKCPSHFDWQRFHSDEKPLKVECNLLIDFFAVPKPVKMLYVLRCLLCSTIYNFTLHGIGKIPSCPLQIYVQSWLTVPRYVTVTGAVTSAIWSFAFSMHIGMRLQVIFSMRIGMTLQVRFVMHIAVLV